MSGEARAPFASGGAGAVIGVIGTFFHAVLVYPLVLGMRIGLLPRIAGERAGPEAL